MRYFLLVVVFIGLVACGLNVVAREQNQAAPELPALVFSFERAEGFILIGVLGYSWQIPFWSVESGW